MSRRPFSVSKTLFVGSMVFLFVPLVVLVVFSFNESKVPVLTGFSLGWYTKLFTNSSTLWGALVTSLSIAAASALAATVMGTLAAIGVNWHQFVLKGYVQMITFVPLVLPEIIMGLSLLAFFSGVKMNLGWWSIFVAHTTFCLPFVYLMVLARLGEFDNSILEAARDLGAREVDILLKVIVPMALPGIISGFVTSLTLSLEDFTITYFVSGVANTLPMVVYNQMYKGGVSPVINALSTIMILGTVVLAVTFRGFLKDIATKG
jgi:spermidine/putrescine transport system permease protein